METKQIRIDEIWQNENSRVVYKKGDLSELMASMKDHGLLQPIGVRKINTGWECVYGNRRLLSAKKLGWQEIAAVVIDEKVDDAEANILNLIENIKRVNTTVAEDGRMFHLLKAQGLSPSEIASRLGIPLARVDLAMEVYSHVPEEFHGIIVNRLSGQKTAGTISAGQAHKIQQIRKRFGLNREQVRSMLNHVKSNPDVSAIKLEMVGPLLKSGVELEQALSTVSNWRLLQIDIYVRKNEAEKLEEKEGRSMQDLLSTFLQENYKKAELQKRSEGDKYRGKLRHVFD